MGQIMAIIEGADVACAGLLKLNVFAYGEELKKKIFRLSGCREMASHQLWELVYAGSSPVTQTILLGYSSVGRASGFGPDIRGFESLYPCHIMPI